MANELTANAQLGKVPIEVFGVDLDGHQFIEQTRTVTITRDGATIALSNKLAPDSELIVRNPAANEETVARVIDLVEDVIFVQVYGIAFIDPSVDLWHVEFPKIESKISIAMECNGCRNVDMVLLSEIEMEIFEPKQALKRRCRCSDSPTIWKKTDRRVTERRATVREANDRRQQASQTQESTRQAKQERRKERRTAIKAIACIRCSGEDVLVECEDMSRGGFRFKNQNAYSAGKPIEVAVP